MLQRYKGTGKFKPFLIYTLCDETFSISSSIEVPINYNKTYFYFWISFLDYIYWIIGTFLGCLLGNHLTFNTTGLDFALTALFVVLFMEQLQKKENILPGLIGIFTSIISLILFGSNQMIIPSMILIIIILLGGKNKICKPY